MSIFDYFKDKKFSNALVDFDKLINKIPKNISSGVTDWDSNNHAVSDLLAALDGSSIDKSKNNKTPATDSTDEVFNMFKDLEVPQDRVNKFKLYESIYDNVQIVKRVITVYLNNVFLSNTISNKVYMLTSEDGAREEDISMSVRFADSFIAKNKLMKKIKHKTVSDMLIYGDGFIEIIDIDDIKVQYPVNFEKSKKTEDQTSAIQDSIAQTSAIQKDLEQNKSDKMFLESIQSRDTLFESDVDRLTDFFVDFETAPSISDEECNDYTTILESDDNTENHLLMDRLVLKFHSPIDLIPLESPYGTVLGYLEIKKKSSSGQNNYNPMSNFLSAIGTLGGNNKKQKSLDVGYSDFADSLIRKVFKKYNIAKSKYGDPKKIESEYIQAIESKVKPELIQSIKKILLASGKSNISNSKLSVRYIKPNRIFHFKYPGAKSVVDTLVYPGKMYLLIQLTNTISRISRSSAVRKWNLDIGTRENGSAVIQSLRNSLRNQRITAADMTTRDISKVMTDFKDLITVNRNGKQFVDVEMIQMGDPSISTQDLEFQRNELVAVSGIPASYLGYNDTYELRDQLVHANISFANEIVGIQDEINSTVLELLSEASSILGKDNLSSSISFKLTPPMVLNLQVTEATMQSFGTIYSQLKDSMGVVVDPIKMLQKFVPYANWKDFAEQGADYNIKKKVNTDPNADAGGF